MRLRLLALSLLALAACESPPAPGAAASASAAAPTPATASPAATATAEVMKAPDDLDVKEMQKLLKCGGDAKAGPCAVVAAFESCVKWNASVPSGDGRWIGRGTVIEGGKSSEEFTIVRARRVPLSDVGPGQLGVKIGVAQIPKEEKEAHAQADRAIRPLARHDVPPKGNLALEYLKNRTDWPEAFAMQTAGSQVFAISKGGVFLCQGPKQQLSMVHRTGSRSHPSDGVYAELWPTSW